MVFTKLFQRIEGQRINTERFLFGQRLWRSAQRVAVREIKVDLPVSTLTRRDRH